MENQIHLIIPEEVVLIATQKLNEAVEVLEPYLLALTSDQRKEMAKMSDKTIPFVEKNLEYSGSAPQFVPPFMDCEALAGDVKVTQQLTPLYRIVKGMSDGLDDTVMVAGSEAYINALNYYNSVKQAAKNNVPVAKSIYDDLSKRFVKTKKAKVTPTPPVSEN